MSGPSRPRTPARHQRVFRRQPTWCSARTASAATRTTKAESTPTAWAARSTVVSYDKTPAELDARFARRRVAAEAVYRPHGRDAQSLRTETAKADFDPAVKREGVVYVKDGELMRVRMASACRCPAAPKLSAKDTGMAEGLFRRARSGARGAARADHGRGWQDALAAQRCLRRLREQARRFTAFRLITRKSTDEDGNVIEKQSRVHQPPADDRGTTTVRLSRSLNPSTTMASSARPFKGPVHQRTEAARCAHHR